MGSFLKFLFLNQHKGDKGSRRGDLGGLHIDSQSHSLTTEGEILIYNYYITCQ